MDHPLRITRLEQRVAAVQAFAHQPCSADFPAFVRSCGRAAGRLARRLLSTTWRTPQQPSITARCVLRNHTSGPRSAGSRRLGGECAHDCVRASCSTVPPSLALTSAPGCRSVNTGITQRSPSAASDNLCVVPPDRISAGFVTESRQGTHPGFDLAPSDRRSCPGVDTLYVARHGTSRVMKKPGFENAASESEPKGNCHIAVSLWSV
jgi:hypothetical protein